MVDSRLRRTFFEPLPDEAAPGFFAPVEQPLFTTEDVYRTGAHGQEGQLAKGIRSGIAGMSAGGLAADALSAEVAGDPSYRMLRDEANRTMAGVAPAAPRVRSLKDIGGVGDAADWALGAFGQGVASMAPTLGAGLAGTLAAGPVGGALAAYGTGYNMLHNEAALGQLSDPELMARSAEDRLTAARTQGAIGGALEAVVPAGLGSLIVGGARRGAKRIAQDALTEGATEGAQTVSGHLVNKSVLDSTAELDGWELADAVAAGALTGGGVSTGAQTVKAGADSLSARREAREDKPKAPKPPKSKDPIDLAQAAAAEGGDVLQAAFPDDVNPLGDDALAGLDPMDPNITEKIAEHDAMKAETAQAFAQSILEDPKADPELKEQINLLGDVTTPEAIEVLKGISDQMRGATRVDEVLGAFNGGDKPAKKMNLQSADPAEQATFDKMIMDSLKPEYQAAVAPRISEIANILLAYSARTSDLTKADIPTLTKLGDLLDMFNDPDSVVSWLNSAAAIDGEQNSFLGRVKSISNASEDIKNPNSFLFTMLSPRAKSKMTAPQMTKLARFVDNFALLEEAGDTTEGAMTILKSAFGGEKAALAVLDYYQRQNRANVKYDADPEAGDPNYEDPTYEGTQQELTTQDAEELTPSFRTARGMRPFLRGRDDTVRDLQAKSTTGSRVGSYAEFLKNSGDNVQYHAKRVRRDLTKRIEDNKRRDTASVQNAIQEIRSAMPDMDPEMQVQAEEEIIRLSQLKTEDRSSQIKGLEAELKAQDKEAETAKKEGRNASEARLGLYDVVLRPEDDLQSSDAQLNQYGSLMDKKRDPTQARTPAEKAAVADHNAAIDATAIRFETTDGKTVVLSAESMWHNASVKSKGVGRAERIKRQFSEAVASMLARPDIKGIKGGEIAPGTVLDRKSGLTYDKVAPKVEARKVSDTERADMRRQAEKTLKYFAERDELNAFNKKELAAALEKATASGDSTIEVLNDFVAKLEAAVEKVADKDKCKVLKSKLYVTEQLLNEELDRLDPLPELHSDLEAGLSETEAFSLAPERMAEALSARIDALQERVDFVQSTRLKEKYGKQVTDLEAQLEDAFDGTEKGKRTFDETTTLPVDQAFRTSKRFTFVGAGLNPEEAALAESRINAGEVAEKVFRETGWFKGPDGKLRKEIDPKPIIEAFIKLFTTDKNFKAGSITSVADVLGVDSQLIKLYPKLKGVGVHVGNSNDYPGVAGQYDGASIVVVPRESLFARLMERGPLNEDPEYIEALGIFYTDGDTAEDTKDLINYAFDGSFGAYANAMAEAAASTFLHELQHAVQEQAGLGSGGNPMTALLINAGLLDDFTDAVTESEAETVVRRAADIVYAKMLDEGQYFGSMADAAYTLYRRLTGEAEAHDVQARLKMTPEERRATPPELMNKNIPFMSVDSFKNVMHLAALRNLSAMKPKPGRPAKMTPDARKEVLDEILRIRGPDIEVAFKKFADIGGSGSWEKIGKRRIIEIALSATDMKSVAWHESLHDFFGTLDGSPETRRMKADMLAAASTPAVQAKLRELLKGHTNALAQLSDPEERLAYAYQFWAAGALTLSPKGVTVFEKIAEFIRAILGIVSQSEKAEQLLAALHKGELSNPNTVTQVLADLKIETFTEKFDRLTGPIGDAVRKTFTGATDRLRAMNVDALTEIADKFDPGVGRESGGLPFLQRRSQQAGVWLNKLQGALEGTTAAQRKVAIDNLQSMKPPSSDLEKALVKILDEMHDYMVDAGVKRFNHKNNTWEALRKVANYFPRVWDRDVILSNQREWTALLAANKVPADQIKAITDAIVNGDGRIELAESKHHLGFVPFAAAVQDRQLRFITPANAELFAKFQSKDMVDSLTGYIQQATHRAEYARDFENNGEWISRKLAEAQRQGATLKELESAKKSILALEGTLGHDMDPKMKELMSAVMTVQNVLILPLAIFSQMVDPMGLAVRTGSVAEAGRAYVRAMKDFKNFVTKNKEKDLDRELTTMLGIIDEQNMLEAMGQTHGSMYMSKTFRNVNRAFFRYNGMQGWNNSMRIAATVAGERYLIANKNNAKVLEELGVTAKDIKVDKKTGRLNVDNPAIKQAMFKFVDGAIIRPNASHRAVWMSDPRFLLIAHLKQFAFSFHKVILQRANVEMQQGNNIPMAMLALYVPVMLASDMAKWMLTGSVPTNWDFYDYVAHGVKRAGLLGRYEFGTDSIGDAGRGDVPGVSFAGPSAEHAVLLAQYLAGGPVSGEQVVDRSIPFARYL